MSLDVWMPFLKCPRCVAVGRWQAEAEIGLCCGECRARFDFAGNFVNLLEEKDLYGEDISQRYGELFDGMTKQGDIDPQLYYSKSREEEYRAFLEETQLSESDLKGIRVLDAGCGVARLTRYLCVRGALAVALDLHGSLAKLAELDKGKEDGTSPLYVGASVQEIPFESCFDVVWCEGVLTYVPDPLAAIKELQRVTCSGGKLYFWIDATVRSNIWYRFARTIRGLPKFTREPLMDMLAAGRWMWRRFRNFTGAQRGAATKQEGLHLRDWSIPPEIHTVTTHQLESMFPSEEWKILAHKAGTATNSYLVKKLA